MSLYGATPQAHLPPLDAPAPGSGMEQLRRASLTGQERREKATADLVAALRRHLVRQPDTSLATALALYDAAHRG